MGFFFLMGKSTKCVQLLKPGVKRSVLLFFAPLIWSAVGVLLMVRGIGWIGSGTARWLVLIALSMGTLKSLFMLDKVAQKNSIRIQNMGGHSCIGAVYSWKTWLLVLLMMGMGIALRTLTTPGKIVGTIYFAIGWALFFSSRHGWLTWLGCFRRG